jgi:flagellum-specific ATP synthase
MNFKEENQESLPLEFIPEFDLSMYEKRVSVLETIRTTRRGTVRKVRNSMLIEITLPDATIGELCSIHTRSGREIPCQVVGFDDETVCITPFAPLLDVGPSSVVISHGKSITVPVGEQLLGNVLDCFGESIQGKVLQTRIRYPLHGQKINPLDRIRIQEQLPLGIRALDLFIPVGEGQRLGIFSTAGQGKSSLMGMLARSSTAEVNVIALIGERGREVLDFIEENLGPEGLANSVVIVSTSDEPPIRRIIAAYTATTIAEYFRAQGKKVLLLMDSITRFARALREIALSLGEAPARQGFPPSVFSTIPGLLERAGKIGNGSITAFYSILLNSEKLEDPLSEEVRAILDGHIYLTSRLSQMGHFPAIDILKSNSRLQTAISSKEQIDLNNELRKILAAYEDSYDLINLGAYKKGSDPLIDRSIELRPEIMNLLSQEAHEKDAIEDTMRKFSSILEK